MHLERHSPARVSALVTLAVLLATSSAYAQTTTATVRGTVFDDTGALPGASIVAKETDSGFTHEATSGADGGFTLPGLRPGSYEISVSMQQFKPAARRLTVLVGQDIDLDFRLTADLVYAENITVVGDTAVETRT